MSSPEVLNRLVVKADALGGEAQAMLGALASEPRLRILELLSEQLLNLSEVAAALDMPLATAVMHAGVLERAGLITTERRPAKRGTQKVCARVYDSVLVQLPTQRQAELTVLELSMPVGAYVDCQVSPTCGLAGEEGNHRLFRRSRLVLRTRTVRRAAFMVSSRLRRISISEPDTPWSAAGELASEPRGVFRSAPAPRRLALGYHGLYQQRRSGDLDLTG